MAHTEVFTVSGAYVIFQVVLYLGIRIVSFLILQGKLVINLVILKFYEFVAIFSLNMLQTLKDPTIIGPYDTIAVYADNDAVDFFKRNGFTDDVVLCSRFR